MRRVIERLMPCIGHLLASGVEIQQVEPGTLVVADDPERRCRTHGLVADDVQCVAGRAVTLGVERYLAKNRDAHLCSVSIRYRTALRRWTRARVTAGA